MKTRIVITLISAIVLTIVSISARGQADKDRTFGLIETWKKAGGDSLIIKQLDTKVIVPREGMKLKFVVPSDTARLFLPDDGFKYIAEVTLKKVTALPPTYDTLWKIVETIEPENPRVQVINRTTYTNSLKQNISNKSFSVVTNVASASSSTVTFEGAMIELWAERYQGHGIIQIYIDSNIAGTFNQGTGQFNTDLQRGSPTFRRKIPPGQHVISVRSTTGQNIVDFFSVYGYTLQPKP